MFRHLYRSLKPPLVAHLAHARPPGRRSVRFQPGPSVLTNPEVYSFLSGVPSVRVVKPQVWIGTGCFLTCTSRRS